MIKRLIALNFFFLATVASVYGIGVSKSSSTVGTNLNPVGDTNYQMIVLGSFSDPMNSRHGIKVNCTWHFVNKDQLAYSGGYHLGYRLKDGQGNTVSYSLQEWDGTGIGSSSLGFTYSGNFLIELEPTESLDVTETVYVIPEEALNQDEEYTVEIRLQKGEIFDSKKIVWSTVSTVEAASPAQYMVFGHGNRKNVIALTEDITINRAWLIEGLAEAGYLQLGVDVRYFRYDPGEGYTSVLPGFEIELVAPDGSIVPIVLTGVQPVNGSGALYEFGDMFQPYIRTSSYKLNFTVHPNTANGLLPCTEGDFTFRVTHRHNDAVVGTVMVSAPERTLEDVELLHMNGQLIFGDVQTTISAVSSGPLPSGIRLQPDEMDPYVTASLTGVEGSINGLGHTYGPDNLDIQLLPSGVAVVSGITNGSVATTAPSIPDAAVLNGVSIRREGVELDVSGATASSIKVRLPRGLGWATDLSSGNRLLSAWLPVASGPGQVFTLDSQLLPDKSNYNLDNDLNASIYLCEESKPLAFETTSVRWYPNSQDFIWTTEALEPVHSESWSLLEIAAILAYGDGVPYEASVKWLNRPSNRKLFRYATLDESHKDVVCHVGSKGDAQLSFQFNFRTLVPGNGIPTNLFLQQPWGLRVPWDGGGHAVVTNDEITDGLIDTINESIVLDYQVAADLRDGEVDCGDRETRTMTAKPADDILRLTHDGGFINEVASAGDNLELAWGLTEWKMDASTTKLMPVHTVKGWNAENISIMTAGSFLTGNTTFALPFTDNGKGLMAPDVLYASGFSYVKETNTTVAERPYSEAYSAGGADYPGFNFRMKDSVGQITGVSHVGGVRLPFGSDDSYLLKQNSKYYVRGGGVSGVHDVNSDTLDGDNLIVYGYPFSFGYYGFAYLDSSNFELDSTTTGSTSFNALPLGTDETPFDLAFDKMNVTDRGQLDSGDLVMGGSSLRPIEYWKASVNVRNFAFAAGDNPCASDRTLTLDIEAYGSLIDQPMLGRVALTSLEDVGTLGNFMSYAQAKAKGGAVANATGRLRMPGALKMRGPADVYNPGEYEAYNLRTMGEAYFNSYDVGGGAVERPDIGFMAFPAKMDVSFFEDFSVHVRMPASNAVGDGARSAQGAMSGGWGTLWEDPEVFDLDNNGFDLSGSPTDYWKRNQDSAVQRIKGSQTLFGIFDLDYNLEWQPALGYFKSKKVTNDFYILETHHQIEYLSPERVDISFGASAGVDFSLNLGNLAINALEGTGVFDAISDAAQVEVAKAIDKGTRSLTELIDAYPESLFNELFDSYLYDLLVGEPSDAEALINQIIAKARQNQGVTLRVNGEDAFDAEIDAVFDAGKPFEQALREALGPIEDTNEAMEKAGNLINEIDKRLMAAQNAIRSITGVALDLKDGESLLRFRDGKIDLGGAQGEVDWNELATLALENDFIRQEAEGGACTLVRGLLGPTDGDVEDLVADTFSRLVARMIILAAEEALSELNLPTSYLDFGSVAIDLSPELEAEYGPTLITLRENLVLIDQTIGEIRKIFDAAQEGTEGARGFLDEVASFCNQDLEGEFGLIASVRAQFRAEFKQQLRVWEGVGSLEELDSPAAREAFAAFVKASLRDAILGSEFFRGVQMSLRQHVYDLNQMIRQQMDAVFAQAQDAVKNQIASLINEIDLGIADDFLSPFNKICAYGEVEGYLSVIGDQADVLRLDALFEMSAPDEFNFHGFMEIKGMNSRGVSGPDNYGVDFNEMIIAAENIPFSWGIGEGLRMDIGTKFTFDESGPRGFGGKFDRRSGEISFETFKITDLGAAAAFGKDENYLAAAVGLQLKDYELGGGVFFGRSYTVEPIAVAHEETAETLYNETGGSFTGALAYGYAVLPISEWIGIPSSCMFRIKAGAGAGVFYFFEGPTYGGMIDAEVSGEALCCISVKGEVGMVGLKAGDDFRFNGKGRVSGKVGSCPFCVKFGKNVSFKYINDQWNISY